MLLVFLSITCLAEAFAASKRANKWLLVRMISYMVEEIIYVFENAFAVHVAAQIKPFRFQALIAVLVSVLEEIDIELLGLRYGSYIADKVSIKMLSLRNFDKHIWLDLKVLDESVNHLLR